MYVTYFSLYNIGHYPVNYSGRKDKNNKSLFKETQKKSVGSLPTWHQGDVAKYFAAFSAALALVPLFGLFATERILRNFM